MVVQISYEGLILFKELPFNIESRSVKEAIVYATTFGEV